MARLLSFTLFALLLASGACNSVVDDCGPFKGKFKTIDFTTAAYRIENGDVLNTEPGLPPLEPVLSPIGNDTLAGGELAIRMTPSKELYFSESERANSISFISAAYACSPPIPSSDEVIRAIEIYSDEALNSAYPADHNLADLFDVVVLNRASGMIYHRFDLNDFLSGAPKAVDEMVLVLNAAPERTSAFEFTVKVNHRQGSAEIWGLRW